MTENTGKRASTAVKLLLIAVMIALLIGAFAVRKLIFPEPKPATRARPGIPGTPKSPGGKRKRREKGDEGF